LAECLGRNIQLGAVDNDIGLRARQTNEAVLRPLTDRHTFSSPFEEFCSTPRFLEPLARSLCLVHSEQILKMSSPDEATENANKEQTIEVESNTEKYENDTIHRDTERQKSIGASSYRSL
jgi:ribosomal protein L16 Arg81 hydroxylase